MTKMHETRVDLLRTLTRHGTVAELGVFTGEFSAQILRYNEPSTLVLVDTWSGEEVSGDKDGHNIVTIPDMKDVYDKLTARYRDDDRVVFHRMRTLHALDLYPDQFFDWVYVDADHRYEAVKADLAMAMRKAKVIAGHDYCEAFEGTIRAVNEFCREFNWHISALTEDKCPSYVLERL